MTSLYHHTLAEHAHLVPGLLHWATVPSLVVLGAAAVVGVVVGLAAWRRHGHR